MREERMAILRMVAEGKITADEAETLLDALGAEPEATFAHHRQRLRHRLPRPPRSPRPPRGARRFIMGMENFAHDLAESVAGSIEDSLGPFDEEFDFFEQEFDSTPSSISVSPGTTLIIKSHGGALTLFGTDEPNLKISGALRGHYKIRQHEDKIEIKAKRFGAALTIHVPRTVERLNIKTNLGEIIARNFTDTLKEAQIRTHTGNIGFETRAITAGKIGLKSHTGMIKLNVPSQSACNIQAIAHSMGDIETDLPLEDIEQGMGYLKGSLNGGGADIRLVTHTGSIFIRSSTPPSSHESPIVTPPPFEEETDEDDES